VNSILLKNILAGSHACNLWLLLFRGSLLRVVMVDCRLTISSVISGSYTLNYVRTRIWTLLLVGDYLDRPLKVDSATLQGSILWARLSTALASVVCWFGSLRKSCVLSESRLLKKINGIGCGEPSDVQRLAMALTVLFIAIYYVFRILLQVWLPIARLRAGWAAGLVLALLMAASLKLIFRR
jgi:hypothetical protein